MGHVLADVFCFFFKHLDQLKHIEFKDLTLKQLLQ